ncbi:putative beta-glucan-binding protein [Phaeomoniella chlamydospora]|uniref:Putative beta-glucan-binding protein n=1 Tax=Phaeomoniella chlamydospora TaxID=158046 RepID=A0A0G2GGK5_PHACM|nr:putative beta-glucan-binding protein [Phaeomoniella chlamydospora]
MDFVHSNYSVPHTTASTVASTPRRSGSPVSDPVADSITPVPRPNPFATPIYSQATSLNTSSAALQQQDLSRRFFHSRRVKKGEVERPWVNKKDPKEKWVTIIPIIGLFVGLAIAGFLVWDGLRTVVHHNYCPILDEDFSEGFNSRVWTKEAEVGGYGNGQFEETTVTDENVFIDDGMLVIKPTLQDEKLIKTNNVINLLESGTCSSTEFTNCVTATNTTNGTIVNPVKSGRINTKKGATIKYGRVEVEARLPAGDWLWPAIWMLPVKNAYGDWPESGEIDIAESRGNNHTYSQGGDNIVSSALHWGPNSANDAWWRTNVKRKALHSTYAEKFHTFGLEWSEKYLFTYIDNRLLQVLYVNFNEPLWERGNFPVSDTNGTRLVDPWSQTGRDSTPFDEDFYLIINVAVGGTNGWFDDGKSGKPWVDASTTAKRDFWQAKDTWYPTWEKNGQMTVKSVKMWQQQGFNGC